MKNRMNDNQQPADTVVLPNGRVSMNIHMDKEVYDKLVSFKEKHGLKDTGMVIGLAVSQLMTQEDDPNFNILVLANGTYQVHQIVQSDRLTPYYGKGFNHD